LASTPESRVFRSPCELLMTTALECLGKVGTGTIARKYALISAVLEKRDDISSLPSCPEEVKKVLGGFPVSVAPAARSQGVLAKILLEIGTVLNKMTEHSLASASMDVRAAVTDVLEVVSLAESKAASEAEKIASQQQRAVSGGRSQSGGLKIKLPNEKQIVRVDQAVAKSCPLCAEKTFMPLQSQEETKEQNKQAEKNYQVKFAAWNAKPSDERGAKPRRAAGTGSLTVSTAWGCMGCHQNCMLDPSGSGCFECENEGPKSAPDPHGRTGAMICICPHCSSSCNFQCHEDQIAAKTLENSLTGTASARPTLGGLFGSSMRAGASALASPPQFVRPGGATDFAFEVAAQRLSSAFTRNGMLEEDHLAMQRVFGGPTPMVPTNEGYTRVGSGRDANRRHYANHLENQGGAAWMASQQPQQQQASSSSSSSAITCTCCGELVQGNQNELHSHLLLCSAEWPASEAAAGAAAASETSTCPICGMSLAAGDSVEHIMKCSSPIEINDNSPCASPFLMHSRGSVSQSLMQPRLPLTAPFTLAATPRAATPSVRAATDAPPPVTDNGDADTFRHLGDKHFDYYNGKENADASMFNTRAETLEDAIDKAVAVVRDPTHNQYAQMKNTAAAVRASIDRGDLHGALKDLMLVSSKPIGEVITPKRRRLDTAK